MPPDPARLELALTGAPPAPDDLVVAVRGGRVLAAGDGLPRVSELAGRGQRWLEVGALGGRRVWGVTLPEGPADGLVPVGLRALYDVVGERLWAVAGRGVQLLGWDRDHRFCGRCATPTGPVPGEHARRCPACGLTAYPRVAPAIIVLVERGEEALLARSARPGASFHSTLAGFVEPGETLEEAVHREVGEEVGVTLGEVRYFGSQPWPFPHSLMVGFRAAYAGGELRPQASEIAEAGWFGADALPPVPPPPSIARALIDDFRRRHGVGVTQ